MRIHSPRCPARLPVRFLARPFDAWSFTGALIIAALWAGAMGVGHAQTPQYPTRAVSLVVPFTPGTGADILARTLGPKLADRWGVAVVTDNRPGASGNIGAEHAAKAAPDGYTVLITATIFASNRAVNARLPYDPIKSFDPVTHLATSAVGLIVTPQFPAGSVKEFVDEVRRHPGKYHYGSPGNGGPQHLAMELLKLDAQISIVHVPYKNSGGAVGDLIGGHVQAMIIPVHTAGPHVRSGKLRMLAVMSAQRLPNYPDVPTMREQGVNTPEVETWYGAFVPAGAPAAVIARLNADFNALLREPDVREVLARQGMGATGGTAAELTEFVKTNLALWARAVQGAGIKAD